MVEFDNEGGVLVAGIDADRSITKLSADADLKGFYNELHDLLVNLQFKDMLGTSANQKKGDFIGSWVKAGESTDGENRTGDMFEKKFALTDNGAGKDIEIAWKAFKKTPYSKFGWFEFQLDVVNRFMVDKELLIGEKKKVVQSGAWEFRNKFVYKNNIINKYLKKIPYVKNSEWIQDMFIKHLYSKTLENEYEFCEEVLFPKINGLVFKYFG